MSTKTILDVLCFWEESWRQRNSSQIGDLILVDCTARKNVGFVIFEFDLNWISNSSINQSEVRVGLKFLSSLFHIDN